MRSIERWHLQWPWGTPNRFSRSRHFWSRISQKRCILGTKLLKNTNRKPYTIYWMVPLSMTLSDLRPRFQSHDIFEVEYHIWYLMIPLKDKVTIAQEETIRNICNDTMFGDLDWPLNASHGFVSISWASCVGSPTSVSRSHPCQYNIKITRFCFFHEFLWGLI